jgi:signal recognition particle subunit SRP54
MFDTLTRSLQSVLRKLRGYGVLTEENIRAALDEIHIALLEADVQHDIADQFIERLRQRCIGEELPRGISPGQQVVRRLYEELTQLLGQARRDFKWAGRPMALMLLGLHGAGKTTTAAKLARRWVAEKKKVLLVACDLRRPAAVEQLRILAGQVGADLVAPEPGETVVRVAERAVKKGARELYDVAIYDTGGRFEINEELVGELRDLKKVVRPHNVVLVLDAAIGQISVQVARRFHEAVGLTGLILTKLDGDARGGAALSVHAATGVPIHLVGVGERPEDLEPFHPDRMAARILGMGDVLTMFEKAQQAAQAGQHAAKTSAPPPSKLTMDELLQQLRAARKMGPLQSLLEMLPGAARLGPDTLRQAAESSEADLRKFEAIILSMTPAERKNPDILDASRRRRIAAGSGTSVTDVNELMRRYKVARKLYAQARSGKIPRFPGLF